MIRRWSEIGIAAQIYLLVAAMFLPVGALLAFYVHGTYRDAYAEASRSAFRHAENVAARTAQFHQQSFALLQNLARRPAVKAMSASPCDAIFDHFLSANGSYANLLLDDAKGDVICNAAKGPNLKGLVTGRPWFKKLMATGQPQVGDPTVGRVVGRWIAALAQPVIDDAGRARGALVLTVDLWNYQFHVDRDFQTSLFLVTILDAQGAVVARSRDAAQWVGKKIQLPYAEIRSLKPGDARFVRDIEGVQQLYGHATVPGTDWVVLISSPRTAIDAEVWEHIKLELAFVSCMFALLLGAAFLLATRIQAPIRTIAHAAGVVGDGRFDVRLPEAAGNRELSILARKFNRMMEHRSAAETRQAQAMAGLAASEERLQRALDASRLALWDYDLVSGKVYLSEVWSELLGGPHVPTTTTFEALTAMTHKEDRPAIRAAILPVIKGDRADYRIEHRLRRPDGGTSWILSEGRVIERDANGRALRAVGTNRDITERKQAEQELRIAAIAFEAQVGMMISDARNVIVRVNRSFTETTGYTAEEVIGKTPRLLSSGHHDAAFYASMWKRIKNTGSWEGEIWDRRKNGEVFPVWLVITAVKSDDGTVTHYVGSHTDITVRKAAEDKINNLAFYDALTGLPNRRLLRDRLGHILAGNARASRPPAGATRSQHFGAIMFLDLDNFKHLNDAHGHGIGDRMLVQVARRLESSVRQGDTVARLGGDEFVVMLEDLDEDGLAAAKAEVVAVKIFEALSQPYRLEPPRDQDEQNTIDYRGTASMGITLFGDQDESVDELLRRADLAMYRAKSAGRNTWRFFDPDMQSAITIRSALEADLRNSLQEHQFMLHYQAQVDGAGCLIGAEALLRWQHPRRGLVFPEEFISLAEETGIILPLGQWVLDTACAQLAAWAIQPEMVHLTMAVNVSARQLHDKNFVDRVLAVLDRTGVDPRQLKLELTESLLVEDVEETITKMSVLKARGVCFSLDDFGTGYSSLSYLKRLPLDQLKIDKSFVRDVLTDPNDAAIARTIVALGQSLGLPVMAEGVETVAQRDFLVGIGCHAYQGFLYGEPGTAEALRMTYRI